VPLTAPLTAQQLAEDHVNLARTEAAGYLRHSGGMPYQDALSAGLFGLVQASQAWAAYCEARGFDSGRMDFFRSYALKRIKGAILDEARRNDPLSRGQRRVMKELAGLPGADGPDEDDAAAAGLAVRKVREARIAAATQWAQALPGDDGANGHVPAAEGADPESAAVVGDILAGFLAAFDGLDAETQVILALRFHRDLDFKVIAERLRTSPERVIAMHDAGVLAVHNALLLAVS